MGCDIHAYIVSDNSYTGEELDLGRNYDFFGALADVRNGGHGTKFTPIAANRGIPEGEKFDVVRAIYKECAGYGHSISWATKEEVIKAIKVSALELEEKEKLKDNYWYKSIINEMEVYENPVLVFFFDS